MEWISEVFCVGKLNSQCCVLIVETYKPTIFFLLSIAFRSEYFLVAQEVKSAPYFYLQLFYSNR